MEERNENSEITHDDIAINIIRYLNITDFSVIDRMTIKQYSLLMEGKRLQNLDDLERIHLLAFKIQVAKNTKTVGGKTVSAFKTFADFFDKQEHETGVPTSKIEPLEISDDEIDIYKLMAKS